MMLLVRFRIVFSLLLLPLASVSSISTATSVKPLVPTHDKVHLSVQRNIWNIRGGALAKKTTKISKPAKVSSDSNQLGSVQNAAYALVAAVAIAVAVFNFDMGKTIASVLTTVKARLLVLMVFQNACTVLVGRYTRANHDPEDLYEINHLVLVCEMLKFVLSAIFEYLATDGHLLESVKENIIDRPMNSVKIVVPSLLYLVQNSLQYVALSNLSAPLFQVTYQTKLLTTAVASVLLLQRQYTSKQWVCLASLGIGVAIVVLGESSSTSKTQSTMNARKSRPAKKKSASKKKESKQNLIVGLSAVTVACVSSALASVYLEKVLKKKTPTIEGSTSEKPVSLWIFNMQMAFFSSCIAAVKNAHSSGKPFLHGFTPWVWALVVLQAGGGLLVAAVMKYADNVLKGLATGVSVVVSTLVSVAFFNTPLTGQFALGASIILASVYYFSN